MKVIMVIKNKKSKKVKIGIVALLVVAIAVGAFFAIHTHNKPSDTKKTAQTGTKPDINYRPPTKEEQQAANQTKQNIVAKEKQQSANESQSGLTKVTPVITYASFDTVNSYVTGVFEDGGVCTATFTQSGTIITRTSAGFANASYTQCAPITPDLPNKNAWSVTINYKSASAEGTSKGSDIK